MLYERSMWVRRRPMSAVATSCPSCHNPLPPGARFCAGCGTRVSQSGSVTWEVASKRTFGVLPGRARWRAARARSSRWLAVFRARVRLVLEVVAAWTNAQVARFQVKRQVSALGRERARCFQALGAAVHEGRKEEVKQVKQRLAELDTAIASAHDELGRIDERMDERIAVAQREDGSTEQVPMPVPEPSPVPSDPPGPVIVPEPEPVPHEPPGPVIVPEPEPPGPPAAS
jgi:Double zinc ribbon